jgi:hypothetical protein
MTTQEEKELRNYCAWLLKEYGFRFPPSDPVLPALYVIHREMESTKKVSEGVIKQLNELIKNMKPTVYAFNQPGEAWKFQMAQGIKWFIIISGFFLASWGWYVSLLASGRIEQAKIVLDYLPRIEKELLPLIRKDDEGFLFLEFNKPNRNEIMNFTEFEKLPNGKVRVYLGKD